MTLLIRNGRVIDPASGIDKIQDILVQEGKIAAVGERLAANANRELDAAGCFVMPGFIDLHVHLREPGYEYKETIETGSRAAAKGGFTTILAMPNTKPVADCPEIIRFVQDKAKKEALVHVLQVGAVTKGQEGQELAQIDRMVDEGSPAISEDGKSVMNSALYREAMKIAAKRDIPVLAHCEDKNLVNGGVMNLDEKSKELALPGISNAVEDVIVARDILLAKETGVRLHLCHCSTKDSVRMVEQAKKQGVRVTAEVCPHHFTLATEEIKGDYGCYKMNPPLRSRQDVEALKQGLKENIMDVIATDHAPHSNEEKAGGMQSSYFGIVGLETAVSLTITELLEPGFITPMQMAEKLSYNPAQIIHSDRGTLGIGKPADIVIIDPMKETIISSEEFVSKGKSTPFQGKKVRGQVKYTIVDGMIQYEEGVK
ncbi:MAG: dihydroorotase [Lachnospiraceae bacterium]